MTPECEKEIRDLREKLPIFGPGNDARCREAITNLLNEIAFLRVENKRLKKHLSGDGSVLRVSLDELEVKP